MEVPESKLGDFIQGDDRAKWIADSNHNITKFTEDEIKRITDNYSTVIGKGGFGQVYKGVLDDNRVVAVKRYIFEDSMEDLAKEVIAHSQVNHKNVVRLVGYSIEQNNALMVVTEYVSKGSLHDILHQSDTPISLDTRLCIAIQCAEALGYMHSSMYTPIVHGDIKPSNILLDDNLDAKISDFGISRFLYGGKTRHTKNVKGSIDYMDPILFRDGTQSSKNDVYSFGAVLLELITRKRIKEEGKVSLITSFTEHDSEGKRMKDLFDANIASVSNMKIINQIGKLATKCLAMDMKKRPKMNIVAEHLRKLREYRNGGHDNTTLWRSFSVTQDLFEKYKQSTRNASYGSTKHPKKKKKKSFAIFKHNSGNSKLLAKLGAVRIFTKKELKKFTMDYSCLLLKDGLAEYHRGILEDNTLVTVKTPYDGDESLKNCFLMEMMILSHISHKNMVKLLGCCLEANIPILVHEYTAKGSLSDIVHHQPGYFSLPLRLKIASETSEALAHIHSSTVGGIVHGPLTPYDVLLDENFMPMVSCFLSSRSITKDKDHIVPVLRMTRCNDPVYMQTGIAKNESFVYSFGVILMVLIRGRMPKDHNFVSEFIQAYEAEDSGERMFHLSITGDQEDRMAILEEMGRMAVRCVSPEEDGRPTMAEVAERLELLRSQNFDSAVEDHDAHTYAWRKSL